MSFHWWTENRRETANGRSCRRAELSAGGDGNRFAGRCHASWWNTRSSRSRAHRISGGGGGSRCFSKRDAINRRFSGAVAGNGSARARKDKGTVRPGNADRSLGVVLRRSDHDERGG